MPTATDTVNFSLAGGVQVTIDSNVTVAGVNVTGPGNWNFGAVYYGRWGTSPSTNGLTATNGFVFSGTGISNVWGLITGATPVIVNSGIVRLSDYNNNYTGGTYVNGGYLTTDLHNINSGGFFGGASQTIYVGSTSAGKIAPPLPRRSATGPRSRILSSSKPAIAARLSLRSTCGTAPIPAASTGGTTGPAGRRTPIQARSPSTRM